jgi:hypothetical protein
LDLEPLLFVTLSRHALFGLLAATPLLAQADPGYYVVTPYDNAGLRSIDLRYWTVKPEGQTEYIWPEIGLGYGVNSRWTTELFVSGVGSKPNNVTTSSWNWQNDVLLTQGELPLDVALHAQFIKEHNAPHPLHLEWGPVLQTDLGRTQLNLNVFFDQAVRGDTPATAQMKYQWQVRYRLSAPLHIGLQGFGELGDWNKWAPQPYQSHRAGPAVFGKIPLGERDSIKLQAAWLVGKTYTMKGHMFTMQAKLEF